MKIELIRRKGVGYTFMTKFAAITKYQGNYSMSLRMFDNSYVFYKSPNKPPIVNIKLLSAISICYYFVRFVVLVLPISVLNTLGMLLFLVSKFISSLAYLMMFYPNTAKRELSDIFSDSISLAPKDIFR